MATTSSTDDYPSTAAYTPTPRFLVALSSFRAMHLQDPSAAPDEPAQAQAQEQEQGPSTPSLRYHSTLELYARKLSALSTVAAVRHGPGEALLLAAASQHVRRWERPRKDYPEGLSGYKMWRVRHSSSSPPSLPRSLSPAATDGPSARPQTSLNKFHADIAHDVMRQAGYVEDDEGDAELFARVRDLLLKKTLQRAPLPERDDELRGVFPSLSIQHAVRDGHECGRVRSCRAERATDPPAPSPSSSPSPPSSPTDPEAHLFEDAVCCTFLHLEFTQFASSFAGDRDKLVRLVGKTWAKMGPLGRGVAAGELLAKLGEEERQVVLDAVQGGSA